MQIFLAILAILALLVFYGFWRLNRTTTQKHENTYGPFVIKSEATTGKAFNMNYGMVDQTTVRQSILYNGQPVSFPSALQTNTGLPFLWRVYALAGTPGPTLLAGSQSLYLVFVRDGKVVVEPVNEQSSDFASVQCLDSENGQPGERSEVYMLNDIEDAKKLDTIQCSQYLLVNNCVVLDVKTLKQTPFNTSNNTVGHYYLNHTPGALGFSPDRKAIVFRGNFSSYDTETKDLPETEGGLVAYDYTRDTGYVLPYNDTELRVTSPDDINKAWFVTYFEWVKNTQGDDELKAKKLDKPANWLGKYEPRDSYYYLFPVKPSMLPVFMDFVLQYMQWDKTAILKDETGEYTGRRIDLGSGTVKLDIGYQSDDQRISFSNHLYETATPETRKLVKSIADAFNAELAAGKHQEHFGSIVSETKRIRGE